MKNKSGAIVILALIGVVAILLIGATYIFYSKLILPKIEKSAPTPTQAVVDPETEAIRNIDPSADDIDSIQKDLDSTDYSTLDEDVLGVKSAASGL